MAYAGLGRSNVTDWDARYAEPGWAFGTEPNDFLREHEPHLRSARDRRGRSEDGTPRPGRVLCLAEGEGRNAVWLAERGYDVTGVDRSAAGLAKARTLARERGVAITTVHADLETFAIEPGAWQGIVSIFAHVPRAVRQHVHAAVISGLSPGGVFLLEAYRPQQLGRGTGGPADDERMLDLERLREELGSLEWLVARELDRDVIEGRCHTGSASVVQLVARRRD
jgi:SAM-dependent methyltransferase